VNLLSSYINLRNFFHIIIIKRKLKFIAFRFLARLQHWLEQNLTKRDSPAKSAAAPTSPSDGSSDAAAETNLVNTESSEKEKMETDAPQEKPSASQKDSDNSAPSQPTENRLEAAPVSNEGADKSNVLSNESGVKPPEYPLFPISRGFCMTLKTHLGLYRKALEHLATQEPPPQ